MASTIQIPYQGIVICESHGLLILLTYEDVPHNDFDQHNLMFHTLLIYFCTCNPTSNSNNYLWNGVLLQPSCKVVTTLQACEDLA